MMQQPVFQQEQASNQAQQQQQQMLLCPVRLVYETQILVQPGDQIQPNQTIVINPQNQPPWAQNRVQNQQVIYVQNVPNSFMPQVHQLEQNQMFLQQNYGFPQVIQHPMIAQNQDQIRTLQMGNVSANMQSQMQTNAITQIMPNERMVTHNFGHVQVNPGINVPNVVQNQIASVPISASNRQIQSVPKTVTEMPNNPHKTQEVQISAPQNYRQLTHHPISHQMNLARAPTHQTIAMIPVPNMVHRPSNLEQNTSQMNSVSHQTIVQTSNMPATFTSAPPNVQVEPRKGVPIMQKGPNQNIQNTVNHTPKNQAYSYRPIQPRPQQFRSSVPTNAMTVQPNMNIQIQPNPNIIDGNRIMSQNIPNTNYQKMDNSNHQFNRKRKSESPDELQRKLTIVPAAHPSSSSTGSMTVKRIENPTVSHSVSLTKVNTHEIGVNTNPVMKINPKISTNNRNMIQISPLIDPNCKIKEELAKPIITKPQNVKPPITVTNITNNNPLPNLNVSSQVEKEKLVRNTVFTQARFGRLLTDKDDVPVNINPLVAKETKSVDKQKDKNLNKEVLKTEAITVSEIKSEETSDAQELKQEEKPKIVEVKEEKPEIIARCAEEKMLTDSMNRLKGTESNELKLKNEKDYILTHVLDGFVIQESNVAFPIRLPLKEKTLGINTGVKDKSNLKEDLSEDRDMKVDKVPDLSHLKLNENERLKSDYEGKKEIEINDGNPFTNLNHSAVKSWTVEQLAIHLSKFNWNDTMSVLQEHEIDGESLMLVSKSQLVSIGVKENHADVINEFVKS